MSLLDTLYATYRRLTGQYNELDKERSELKKRQKYLENMIKQFPDAKSAVKKARNEMNDCIEDLGNAITGSTGVTNARIAISQESTQVYGCDSWEDKGYLEFELQRVKNRIAELDTEIKKINNKIAETNAQIQIEKEQEDYRNRHADDQSSGGNNGGCGC